MEKPTHFRSLLLIISAAMLVLVSCKTGQKKPAPEYLPGNLIFQSGFEPGSEVVLQSPSGADIVGSDSSVPPPNNWVVDLEENSGIGEFRIQYQGGSPEQRFASVIEDPTKPGNHVLQYWMHQPNVNADKPYGGKFRIQTNLYENTGIHEIYYKVRMYLTEDWSQLVGREEGMSWFILAEYWNNGGWTGEDYVFRMHLTINKDKGKGSPLYFGISGQTKPEGWKEFWHHENRNYNIPVGKWLSLEINLKEGDEQGGRYWLRVSDDSGNGEEIFDVRNFTHHPDDPAPDGYGHLNPLKGYSHRENINFVREAGGTLQILWDDFQLYDGLVFPD